MRSMRCPMRCVSLHTRCHHSQPLKTIDHPFSTAAHASPTAAHASPTAAHASPTVAHALPTAAHASPTVAHALPTVAHASPTVAHALPTVAHCCPREARLTHTLWVAVELGSIVMITDIREVGLSCQSDHCFIKWRALSSWTPTSQLLGSSYSSGPWTRNPRQATKRQN